MKRLIPLVVLLAVLTVFSSYSYGILASNDDQLNVEGTAYEDGYESNAKVQTASSTILGVFPLILVAIMFVVGLSYLKKSYR